MIGSRLRGVLTYACVVIGAFGVGCGGGSSDLPDLIGTITKVKVKEKDDGFKLIVRSEVCNWGTATARGPFHVALYLSENDTLERDEDRLLDSFSINKINPAKCKQSTKGKRTLKGRGLDRDDLRGRFAILVIDDASVITEQIESNNIAAQPVE